MSLPALPHLPSPRLGRSLPWPGPGWKPQGTLWGCTEPGKEVGPPVRGSSWATAPWQEPTPMRPCWLHHQRLSQSGGWLSGGSGAGRHSRSPFLVAALQSAGGRLCGGDAVHLCPPLHSAMSHCSLNLVMVGKVTPRKLANATNRGGFVHVRVWVIGLGCQL